MIQELFQSELNYLWSKLARAGRGHGEEVEALLSRDGDPRVARLVQSAAYAFARVREKLTDDLPELSHALVASTLPEALRATPSATVVQIADDRRVRMAATRFDRQKLSGRASDGAPSTFETSWPVDTSPIVLVRGDLRTREPGLQVLTLRLEAYPRLTLSAALPGTVRIFVRTKDPNHAIDVVHAICGGGSSLRARILDKRGHELSACELPTATLTWTALAPGALPLVRGPADRFSSGTALRCLFTFPEAFGFFDLTGLRAVIFPEAAHTLEVSVRLRTIVEERSAEPSFHLHCAPAVNVFEAPTAPLPLHGLGPCGTLSVTERPACEILEILDAWVVPDRNPDAIISIRPWETYRGKPYVDDELYLRPVRRAGLRAEPTQIGVVLLRPNGATALPAGILRARVLASDGHRTEALLPGDVAQRSTDSAQMANLTRVTPAWSPCLDARMPWRLNAYARMPVSRFCRAASLASYLDLHDPTGTRRAVPRGAHPAVGGVVAATRTPATRVVGSEVRLGDEIDIILDDNRLGGPGPAWLVAELLARAASERADFLRFTRTRLVDAHGSVRSDYGVRSGDRLPPPFG